MSMFDRLPDRTFVFGIVSVFMSLGAFAYLAFGSAIEVTVFDADGNASIDRVSIGESHGLQGLFFAVVPVVLNVGALIAIPPSGKTEKRHKFNLVFGSALMWIFVGIFMRQLGLLYLPAAAMLTSVVVLVFIRERTWGKHQQEKSNAQTRRKSHRELRDESIRRRRRSRNRVGRRPARRSTIGR